MPYTISQTQGSYRNSVIYVIGLGHTEVSLGLVLSLDICFESRVVGFEEIGVQNWHSLLELGDFLA